VPHGRSQTQIFPVVIWRIIYHISHKPKVANLVARLRSIQCQLSPGATDRNFVSMLCESTLRSFALHEHTS